MEFPFDVNYVLPYEVTIFNGDYRILNQGQTARVLYGLKRSYWFLKMFIYFSSASDKLTSIIDAIGEASYKVNSVINLQIHYFVYIGTGIIWCGDNCT